MQPLLLKIFPNIQGTLMMRVEKIERLIREINDNKVPSDFDPRLLTILEASKLVNLSVATIYSKVCRNEIPVNKQDKKLYFIRSEVLEWIRSGRIKTISELQSEVEEIKEGAESPDFL